MREEDKVLLIYEIMGFDTSLYVNKYIEELRSSNTFILLCENVAKARNINSYKAQRLVDEFETLDFYQITTLRQFFVLKAKINYLLSNSEDLNYLNPFFYGQGQEEIVRIGDISLLFDQKNYSLNDIILDERYTTKYKISHIKDKYLEWRKEVQEKVIDPLKLLKVKENQIPNLNYRNSNYYLFIFEVIILNFTFIFIPILPSTFILNLYQGNGPIFTQVIFNLIVICLVYIDVCAIIRINILRKKYDSYRIYKKILKKSLNAMNNINYNCEKLYKYILDGVNKKQPLDDQIIKYSLNKDDLNSIAYLFKITSGDITEDSLSDPYSLSVVLGFISMVILCVLLVIGYIIFRGMK